MKKEEEEREIVIKRDTVGVKAFEQAIIENTEYFPITRIKLFDDSNFNPYSHKSKYHK